MKKLFFLCAIVISINSIAQSVGIGTTTPQSTLDVKGNVRTGGSSNFILYDSLSGKITWTNSNLWVTNPQYLMKHSATAEGLYSNGVQLEYRNSAGNPIFFTNWALGKGYFSGRLGIGTVNPANKLHIWDGTSGIAPFVNATMVIETNGHTYINLLSPDPFETGVLFGSGSNAVSGLISYNSTTVPKGFIFNNNGNQTRMVIDNTGNVGIGTTNPQKNLSVQKGINIDQADGNTGSAVNAITFGNGSGEGIGSKRNAGGNQWGLDFYTGSSSKMSITNGGNVGIGTTNPAAKLQISAGDASFALFGPNSSYGGMLYVGASPNNQSAAQTAQILASDGNLHIDPASGKNIYLGYFQPRDIYLNPNGGNLRIGTTSAPAYPVDVTGNSSITGNFVNTACCSFTNTAVAGTAVSAAGSGYGVSGNGGYIGVIGQANMSGDGYRYGLRGAASNGTTQNVGAYGAAAGGPGAITIGVWGDASGPNSWAGYFTGSAYTTGTFVGSDRKLKKDITRLDEALSIINQLNPSVYTYRTSEFRQMQLPDGIHYGLIADEVQKIIPGIVKKTIQPAQYENHDEHNGKMLNDKVEFNSVNYTEIIPILIGGMKEQQVIIDNQNKKIDQQHQQIDQLLKEIQLIKEKLK